MAIGDSSESDLKKPLLNPMNPDDNDEKSPNPQLGDKEILQRDEKEKHQFANPQVEEFSVSIGRGSTSGSQLKNPSVGDLPPVGFRRSKSEKSLIIGEVQVPKIPANQRGKEKEDEQFAGLKAMLGLVKEEIKLKDRIIKGNEDLIQRKDELINRITNEVGNLLQHLCASGNGIESPPGGNLDTRLERLERDGDRLVAKQELLKSGALSAMQYLDSTTTQLGFMAAIVSLICQMQSNCDAIWIALIVIAVYIVSVIAAAMRAHRKFSEIAQQLTRIRTKKEKLKRDIQKVKSVAPANDESGLVSRAESFTSLLDISVPNSDAFADGHLWSLLWSVGCSLAYSIAIGIYVYIVICKK